MDLAAQHLHALVDELGLLLLRALDTKRVPQLFEKLGLIKLQYRHAKVDAQRASALQLFRCVVCHAPLSCRCLIRKGVRGCLASWHRPDAVVECERL